MTFAAILEVVLAFLKYPDVVLRLIRAVKATPEEEHQKLVSQIEAEAKSFEDSGRPG